MTTAVQEEIQAIPPGLSLQAHERAAHSLARGDWSGPAPAAPTADEPAWLFFTSGTTGDAKIVLHTHASYGLGHQLTGKGVLHSL